MPRCSVLIPAFNVEGYVARAVESALSQTYPDVEVIVVNDGSTDRTAAALEPFRDRIIYVDQSNRGLAGARNRALEEASGDYIALLDADDYWPPHRLERMIEDFEAAGDFGFITSDAHLVYDSGDSSDTYYSRFPRSRRFRSRDQARWILQYNFVFIMTVVRRELFDKYGAFDAGLRACEDWELWMRFLLGGERVALVDKPLGYYRLRTDALTGDPKRALTNELLMFERIAQKRMDNPGFEGRLEMARAKKSLVDGDTDSACIHFAKAAGSDLPSLSRLQALAFSKAPQLARRYYVDRPIRSNKDRNLAS